MDYFSGVNFLNWGDIPDYGNALDIVFGDYYGIQYNHAGNFFCNLNDGAAINGAGPHAFITYPGGHFRYGAEPGSERHHVFVCFRGPRVNRYLTEGLLTVRTRNPVVKISHGDIFYLQMTELQDCLAARPARYERAVLLLESLLLHIDEDGRAVDPVDDRLKYFFRELADNIGRTPQADWDFHVEAARQNLSYPHFRRLFVRFLGSPPGQYLLRCRLDAAASELRSGDRPLAEIAEAYLFCDVHHFSKLFRKYYCLPPARFRAEFMTRDKADN